MASSSSSLKLALDPAQRPEPAPWLAAELRPLPRAGAPDPSSGWGTAFTPGPDARLVFGRTTGSTVRMLELIHAPRTRSTRFVWLLEELGADYSLRYVSVQRADGSGTCDPQNPHPDGKVPALVHDGVLVTESAAIALYLTDLFPSAGIGPQVAMPARGTYLSWLSYYAGVIEPVLTLQLAELLANPLVRSTFRGREEVDLRIVRALRAGPYLCGSDFTGADLLVASMGQFSRQLLPEGALVDTYLERCLQRPALARALEKDSPPGAADPPGA